METVEKADGVHFAMIYQNINQPRCVRARIVSDKSVHQERASRYVKTLHKVLVQMGRRIFSKFLIRQRQSQYKNRDNTGHAATCSRNAPHQNRSRLVKQRNRKHVEQRHRADQGKEKREEHVLERGAPTVAPATPHNL